MWDLNKKQLGYVDLVVCRKILREQRNLSSMETRDNGRKGSHNRSYD